MHKIRAATRLGVVDQVVRAFQAGHLLATVLGFVIGGVVPAATYLEAHHDLDPNLPLYAQGASYLVLGGLVFSAKTVFAWGALAFRDGWKAAGFVVLVEGVMITSTVPLLPLVLLGILVAINGIATGCTLSLDRTSQSAPKAQARSADVTLTPNVRVPRKRRRLHDELVFARTDRGQHQGELFAA